MVNKSRRPDDKPFSPYRKNSTILFLTGQIGTGEDGKLVPGGVGPETIQAISNIEKILLGMEDRLDLNFILMIKIFLIDEGDYQAMEEAYKNFWRPGCYPARSCFFVSGLLNGARVLIEAVVSLSHN